MVIRFIFLFVFSLKILVDKINLTGGERVLVLAAKRENQFSFKDFISDG